MTVKNSNGQIFYGMHFYPGVAEYQPPNEKPFRIFINEDTIRKMNPTFAGRPIFVEHVDEVDADVDQVKTEADGWVVESFFNAADGKTWAKFIIVSKRGLSAIQRGYKLSNAYIPESFGKGGLWNGVTYDREVTGGKHEHLAIVKDPRYQESQILSPEQFKDYNEGKEIELKRLANSNEKEKEMSVLQFFKRKTEKLENSAELAETMVTLPKSKVEKTIVQLVNEADAAIEAAKAPRMANDEDMYMMGNDKMSVGDMAKKFNAMKDELDKLKANAGGDDAGDEHADVESLDNGDELPIEEGKKEKKPEATKNAKGKVTKVENEADEEESEEEASEREAQAAKGKENFNKLANAHKVAAQQETAKVEIMADQVARGKARYGS
jgi:hypothetical protein